MPALVALGAKLGNKCDITPMLRYRENGLWYWPVNVPRGEFFTVEGLDQLSDREAEVCLLLGLTAVPEAMRSTAESLGTGRRVGVCPHGVPGQRRPRPPGRWRLVPAADAGVAAPVGGRARCSASARAAVRVQRGVRVLRTSRSTATIRS